MIDCSKELEQYWNEKVKMPQKKYEELIEKRDNRLKKIESEIKNDKKIDLKIVEKIHQGSCRMKTLIQQNEEYDIDMGIVFDSENLKENNKTHPNTIKEYILKKLKDDRFAKEPEKKKNCIRIYYKDNFHIDMVIYKKENDIYYLASNEWEESNPKNINKWFDEEKSQKQYLKKIVQLLKKWSKSRESWNMPSGLIFSILAAECYDYRDRIDESFYYTLKNIFNRLEKDKTIKIPNTNIEITQSNKHKNKVENLFNKLKDFFDGSETINSSTIENTNDKKKALLTWKKFFNDDFFEQIIENKMEANIVIPNKPWKEI